MSYESIIIANVSKRNGSAGASLACSLLNLDGSVIQENTTSLDGRTTFTGVAAGVYNIKVVGASGNYNTNYELKNSYVIPIGESSSAFESRTSIRSGEVITGSGVLTQNHVVNVGVSGATFGTVTTIYRNPWDNTPVTGSSILNKQLIGLPSGNAYYHLNQNLTNVQRVKISIGE